MIISASRRTDIPAYFPDWLLNRTKAGYACVRNPYNPHQVSRISLSPEVVDCIVFWSKNPEPMLGRLRELGEYMYYFQYTLNAYGRDVEPNLPPIKDRIRNFRKLSESIGKERVIWRYDPVFLSEKYSLEGHVKAFSGLARELSGYTEKCVFSFVDVYGKISRKFHPLQAQEKEMIAGAFSGIAKEYGIALETCAEEIDLSAYGIGHAHCIDGELISKLIGYPLHCAKDASQRPACGCAASIDLGMYNTCRHGCSYCYANNDPSTRNRNLSLYDPESPVLCGAISQDDKVVEKKTKSFKDWAYCGDFLGGASGGV